MPDLRLYDARDAVLVLLHEPDARAQHVPEAVIQDLWRQQRFATAGLRTTDGEPVTVLAPGTLNTDAGPDFVAAHLRIGPLTWTGDVEVHRTSGEWVEHRHAEDPRYDRVVLHVTLLADRFTGALTRPDGTALPEVVLYPLLQDSLRRLLYRFYAQPRPDFYCAPHWPHVPVALRRETIRRFGRERLDAKVRALAEEVPRRPGDPQQVLEQLLYERVLRALGYAKNAEPMHELARRVPLDRLRTLGTLQDVEAVLFGAAGLLPHPRDLLGADRATADYALYLRDRFEALGRRHAISAMAPTAWRFFRLRPNNFPTRRIAQAAALCAPGGLLHHDPVGTLLAALAEPRPRTALRRLLTNAAPTPFWQHHVRLDRSAAPSKPHVGRARADRVLVNAVLPLLLLHADGIDAPDLAARVRDVLDDLPAHPDEVTRRFAAQGTKPRGALEAQGLHHLYRTRCAPGHCLACPIGQHVLSEQQAAGSGPKEQ